MTTKTKRNQIVTATVLPEHGLTTVSVAMQVLGFSRPTIAKMIDRGELNTRNQGRAVRITVDSILAYVRG